MLAGEERTGSVSRIRWFLAWLLGSVLFLGGLFVSHIVPDVFWGIEVKGPVLAVVALLFASTSLMAVAIALRFVKHDFRDIGLTVENFRADAAIGVTVAVVWSLLQFLVIIPNTGGAERSDIVANRAQIGTSELGLFAMLLMAWLGGGLAEELFFRGHFMTTLQKVLGHSIPSMTVVVAITVIVFASLHGYQGWVGILDTGLYGGLTISLLYLWRKRLTACIVAHGLFDTIAVIMIFFWY